MGQAIDLFVGQDIDGDGPEASEAVCSSTIPSFGDYCNIVDPAAGDWWILVHTSAASGTPPDAVTLAYAVVPRGDAGNMRVEGLDALSALTPSDVRVFWDEPLLETSDRWYGAFTLGTDPGSPEDIGTVYVDLIRHKDDVVNDTSQAQLDSGELVTLSCTLIVKTNVIPEALFYPVKGTPSGVTYVPGPASASCGTVQVVGDQVIWK
jgi:hypothetical protein